MPEKSLYSSVNFLNKRNIENKPLVHQSLNLNLVNKESQAYIKEIPDRVRLRNMNYSIDYTLPVPDTRIKRNAELERSNRMMRWREKKEFTDRDFISEIKRNNHS